MPEGAVEGAGVGAPSESEEAAGRRGGGAGCRREGEREEEARGTGERQDVRGPHALAFCVAGRREKGPRSPTPAHTREGRGRATHPGALHGRRQGAGFLGWCVWGGVRGGGAQGLGSLEKRLCHMTKKTDTPSFLLPEPPVLFFIASRRPRARLGVTLWPRGGPLTPPPRGRAHARTHISKMKKKEYRKKCTRGWGWGRVHSPADAPALAISHSRVFATLFFCFSCFRRSRP